MSLAGYRLHAAGAVVVAGALIVGAVNGAGRDGPAPRVPILGTHPAWATSARLVAGAGQPGLGGAVTSWQSPPPGQYPADYDGSGGGGVSTLYTQPPYQHGVVPASLATRLPDGAASPVPMRVVPNVSAVADPGTGFLIGQTALQPDGTTYAFSLSSIGGTSLATPVFAGIEADAQQAAGRPIGFANPAIYSRYGTAAFRDVTDSPAVSANRLAQVRDDYTDPYTRQGPVLASLRALGVDGEGAAALRATRGYDDATGVGSPWYYIRSF
ncbi:MAG: hypothetical protein ACRDN0_34045 [Trebonia sp.]